MNSVTKEKPPSHTMGKDTHTYTHTHTPHTHTHACTRTHIHTCTHTTHACMRTHIVQLTDTSQVCATAHSRGPDSIPGQSVQDLWWTRWRQERLSYKYFSLTLSVPFNQSPILIYSFTQHQCYVISAIDSITEYHN